MTSLQADAMFIAFGLGVLWHLLASVYFRLMEWIATAAVILFIFAIL